MSQKTVKVKIFRANEGVNVPQYATINASGLDVMLTQDITLQQRERKVAVTGHFVAIPEGYEIQVRPRSGVALKKGVGVANSPGTIDADYRGEIGVILINNTNELVYLQKGERIAQYVLCEVPKIEWEEVSSIGELGDTERGEGAYGSTGSHEHKLK